MNNKYIIGSLVSSISAFSRLSMQDTCKTKICNLVIYETIVIDEKSAIETASYLILIYA
jgi:hypothetical protein